VQRIGLKSDENSARCHAWRRPRGRAAAYLASGSKPAPAPQVVQAPASMQTEEVLVAAKELNFGAGVGDGDIS
jgi:Flp pilus assembly protein CpaB